MAHRLGDILNGVLAEHHGRALDVVTAYFTVGGFSLLRQGLESLGSFRMIPGAEPTPGEQIGLPPDAGIIKGLIERDLVLQSMIDAGPSLNESRRSACCSAHPNQSPVVSQSECRAASSPAMAGRDGNAPGAGARASLAAPKRTPCLLTGTAR